MNKDREIVEIFNAVNPYTKNIVLESYNASQYSFKITGNLIKFALRRLDDLGYDYYITSDAYLVVVRQ